MGLFTDAREMRVDGVEVINGVAGEPWLYEVDLTDTRTGEPLRITDWGRDLKVPPAGVNVQVSAAPGTWKLVDAARRESQFPELSGLNRIHGPEKEIGYVGLLNYEDRPDKTPASRDKKTTHIQGTLSRWLDALLGKW